MLNIFVQPVSILMLNFPALSWHIHLVSMLLTLLRSFLRSFWYVDFVAVQLTLLRLSCTLPGMFTLLTLLKLLGLILSERTNSKISLSSSLTLLSLFRGFLPSLVVSLRHLVLSLYSRWSGLPHCLIKLRRTLLSLNFSVMALTNLKPASQLECAQINRNVSTFTANLCVSVRESMCVCDCSIVGRR